jgi:hypothetical protein
MVTVTVVGDAIFVAVLDCAVAVTGAPFTWPVITAPADPNSPDPPGATGEAEPHATENAHEAITVKSLK